MGEQRTSLSVPRIEGRATPTATAALAARHGAGYGELGGTRLTCSRLGFGGYRVDDSTPEHRDALTRALRGGGNLIDTSTNYMDGGSERLVGEVLASLARDGTVTRDQIILLEYDQTDRFSWILSRNEDRTYALDVRVRHAF